LFLGYDYFSVSLRVRVAGSTAQAVVQVAATAAVNVVGIQLHAVVGLRHFAHKNRTTFFCFFLIFFDWLEYLLKY